jgi:serine/threonine protein kinase
MQGRLFIVTEYAQGGSLHDLIKRQEGPLPEQLVWRLFIQVSRTAQQLEPDGGPACAAM